MTQLLHPHSPFRIFAISGIITISSILAVWYNLGVSAMFVTIVLILVEVTFSFDNAIINAKVLATMSRFWQNMFMTVGMLIAVFGMRLVFPILLVMLTTGLGASEVTNLALNDPNKYAEELHRAHPYIAAFGGMFLCMLALAFFFDPGRKIHWISVVERPLARLGRWWIYTGAATLLLLIVTILPWNHYPKETLLAGGIGIVLYLGLHALTEKLGAVQDISKVKKQTVFAGFMSFMYLQVLDGSFSFDGVIGAFAVTNSVILIAIGLGIGALWVRSLTLMMVRRNTLSAYRYLEHGAHYTIGVLGIVLLLGLFVEIPEVIAGAAGIIIVGTSIISSVAANRRGVA